MNHGEGLDQQVEALLRFEPSDRANEQCPAAQAERRPRRRNPRRVATECLGSMPFSTVVIRAGSAPYPVSSRPISLDTAIDAAESARARSCRPGSSRRRSRGRVAGPAVRRRQRGDAGRAVASSSASRSVL